MNIDGTEYVIKSDLDAMRVERDAHKRTLALAHMFLFEREPSEAQRIIERDTGFTYRDAQAVRGVVDWATKPPGPQPQAGGSRVAVCEFSVRVGQRADDDHPMSRDSW